MQLGSRKGLNYSWSYLHLLFVNLSAWHYVVLRELIVY